MRGLPGPAGDTLDGLLRKCERVLGKSGQLQVQSGILPWSEGTLTIHTDYGPPQQDKDTNQDYVLAWSDGSTAEPTGVRWAIALADGVTSSFWAEVGAHLACYTSLAGVLSAPSRTDRARSATDAAGDAIGSVADIIASAGDLYRPEGEFHSTWRYILREGLLLQTTLTLAWQEDDVIHLATVGDGGVALEHEREGVVAFEVLAGASAETSRVHALGPANRKVSAFDHRQLVGTAGILLLALYTDGVGRAVDQHLTKFQHHVAIGEASGGNLAKQIIAGLLEADDIPLDDNLTLATLRRIVSPSRPG